jgi:hypothetical protein
LSRPAKYLNKPNPTTLPSDCMADHELFQLEDIDVKESLKDLALVWRQFDRLVDIEEIRQKK